MQLFSGRSKEHKSGYGGGGGKYHADAAAKESSRTMRHKSGKCRALCCGASRLSVSSSASFLSADAAPEPLPPLEPQPRGVSKLAHGMVQARLQSMIDAAEAERRPSARRAPELTSRHRGPCAWARGGGCYEKSDRSGREVSKRTCVVLLAEDRRTHDPREEFRRSIAEVIVAKRMSEPAELRALLNCYVSVNAREHRAAILEAFHEVCSGFFSCKC
ncbi:probable transcription repressor OFP9 [Phragmites australis]|uniref:probable transcription repressor OFP9 n=1 Tax=Phragmites australis TaxID=29695 RepID=UPI002D79F853|nr:probable transcription repressor OFP9 [Phragmites australis]